MARVVQKALASLRGALDEWRLVRLALKVAEKAHADREQKPIAFVNISSRIGGLSQNAAFSMLTAMGLQMAKLPVIYFACRAGLEPCVLGTNREEYAAPPPCKGCLARSKRVFLHALTEWFTYHADADLEAALAGLSVEELGRFSWQGKAALLMEGDEALPLGALVLPSLRWALRRYSLPDDEPTRALLRRYILSAWNVAVEFCAFLQRVEPAVVVIFNGIMYPEAAARWVAQRMGVRVITHEVGFEPFSAFFTDGEATAYPISIPAEFALTQEQNERLDDYLTRRFQGDFSMAGIRFWKEMKGLDEGFLQRAAHFRQVVAVFTNVIYDTSQIHANVVFEHMFAWLDLILDVIRSHPETLFVIRAHPDEMRPGTRKQSRESVRAWVETNDVAELPNVVFVDSQEYISSYQLIGLAKFVMVYNSSIGMEATLLGKAVLCGGKARYTQYPTVFFPATKQEYRQMAQEFLSAGALEAPQEFVHNARRFLYYQLYRTALPFGAFLESAPRAGFVRLRRFSPEALKPEWAAAIRAVVDGILKRQPFLLEE